MARYYDQDGYPVRPNGLLKVLACLCVIALAFVAVVTQWQTIAAYLPKSNPIILIATPTAGTAPRATPTPYQPPRTGPIGESVGMPSIADYNATATAQYQAAIDAPAPMPNTGQGAPVVLTQRESPERLPAGDNVPTAGPVPQTEVDGAFGSKPVLINPQETHQCKHGQVWVDGRGCKNP